MFGVLIVGALALTVACSGNPAPALPQPTADQVQSVRAITARALDAADMTLTLAHEAGVMLDALPVSASAKNAYDCALVTTFGTTNASPAVVQACGAAPSHEAAPFARAVDTLRGVTTCPSLTAAAQAFGPIVDPLLTRLESSATPAATFAGLALRRAYAYLVSIGVGGVACSA
jgi:hypothetical protein